ncbi:olfactory receptor 10AG1-like [Sardina pilchardus]|uniref:olfactory receptor 10AG1-like n=1 Tax=Sardina pilchardus TaxID=27697 RepID=UPI002E10D45F
MGHRQALVLTVMSYDRYVAICRPLQYHSIVTPRAVLKLLVVAWTYPLFWDGSVNLPIGVRNALAIQFLIFPPLLDPLIYGLQLPQIRKVLRGQSCKHKMTCHLRRN